MHDPEILQHQIRFTEPEYVMYIPKYKDYESDNVHLHVVDHPQFGGLIAFWTQSTEEGAGDNHTMMARSRDSGKTWSEAKFILGARPTPDKSDMQAHWAFPAVSRSGRIYLFYYRETGVVDFSRMITGVFACVYSDDFGDTWSESYDIPLRQTRFDRFGQNQNNCCYQIPRRFADGKYLFGYTKMNKCVVDGHKTQDSRVYFVRFENLDDDPHPKDLKLANLPDDEDGITVPHRDGLSFVEEPCIAQLPDGRLICTLRTRVGSAYYTVSDDLGHTWRKPEPLLFDDGTPFVHPVSPCPIYHLGSGKYAVLYHGAVSDNIYYPRNPLDRVYGQFDAAAHQPVRFSAADRQLYMSLPEEGRKLGQWGLAMYGCHVKQDGRDILWYPDRKFFLLGKEL